MSFPKRVTIVEVGPRDGLQNESEIIPTPIKIEFIHQLAAAGLSVIEATSFVSKKWVPALADGSDVLPALNQHAGVRYPVLVPNETGLNAALAAGAKDIAVFTTPSETFSMKNTNCTVADSLARMKTVITQAKHAGCRVRAYISCVLGCPYEGDILPDSVAAMAYALMNDGCDEISLGDTIGVGTPGKTLALLETVMKKVHRDQLAVHFHDTYGQALVNIYVALQCGIATIDSAVAGLGGCPYAAGASGNVATEDVVYLLNGMGIETGVNLEKLIAAGRFIAKKLGHPPRSRVNAAFGDK
ncbi:MAG TPA: hydroxymethylglutaryl-CoA lyase [Gammaproteobacteria bacterium]|nr:hydroxymethylglutaryl-CoA lyase [Gammaproteobacteria bacterium]